MINYGSVPFRTDDRQRREDLRLQPPSLGREVPLGRVHTGHFQGTVMRSGGRLEWLHEVHAFR